MTIVLASARTDIASYVDTLIGIYILLIFAYIVTSLIFAFGLRIPYSRWSDAILTFLRDVCEPYLRIFRRFIPPFGPMDFSPMIGILVLYVVRSVLVNAIHG